MTTRKAAQPELPDAFHRITSLLHTMRCIAQHEDRLCVLRNEIKRTKAVGPALRKDLHVLLEELSSEEYTSDLHAVESALSSLAPAKRTRRSPVKKAAKPAQAKRVSKTAGRPA